VENTEINVLFQREAETALYKMKGLDLLYGKYKESVEYDRVHRPPMFYTFSKRKDVTDSFKVGKPDNITYSR
jgi:hypothetical protein